MKMFSAKIRTMRPEESGLLRTFLYQAIYLPAGVEPPPQSVIDLPELQVYLDGFGRKAGDHCFVAEVDEKIVGAAWSRIMKDYGHIDDSTPSLAISLLPEYRGHGIGTQLLNRLLLLLQDSGYSRVSLSVQAENPALSFYKRAGFHILEARGTEYRMVRHLTRPAQQEDTKPEEMI